jgi:hypothetical protein
VQAIKVYDGMETELHAFLGYALQRWVIIFTLQPVCTRRVPNVTRRYFQVQCISMPAEIPCDNTVSVTSLGRVAVSTCNDTLHALLPGDEH